MSRAFIVCFIIFCFLHFVLGSKVSANSTAFSCCYSDLSSILLSSSCILLPYFIKQLANNLYILKCVFLLLNMVAKRFWQPFFKLYVSIHIFVLYFKCFFRPISQTPQVITFINIYIFKLFGRSATKPRHLIKLILVSQCPWKHLCCATLLTIY